MAGISYGLEGGKGATNASVLPRFPAFPENEYRKLGYFARKNLVAEINAMAKTLLPIAKAELASSYLKSGVKIETGKLWEATVSGVTIETYAGGFLIFMKAKVKYDTGTGNVYGSAMAKKFGGIKVEGAKRLTGTLRKYAQAGGVAGTVIMKPFPDFFTIGVGGPTVRAFEAGLNRIMTAYQIVPKGKAA